MLRLSRGHGATCVGHLVVRRKLFQIAHHVSYADGIGDTRYKFLEKTLIVFVLSESGFSMTSTTTLVIKILFGGLPVNCVRIPTQNPTSQSEL